MSIGKILFSFSGRIPRQTYWLASLSIGVVGFVLMVFAAAISVPAGRGARASGDGAVLLMAPIYLCMIWCSLAVTVKRWHDLGKSGFWVLIVLVPFIGPLWSLLELGFFEGTPGPNGFDDGDSYASFAQAADDLAGPAGQVAGRSCVYCYQKIASAFDGEPCGECARAVHTVCRMGHVADDHKHLAPSAAMMNTPSAPPFAQ